MPPLIFPPARAPHGQRPTLGELHGNSPRVGSALHCNARETSPRRALYALQAGRCPVVVRLGGGKVQARRSQSSVCHPRESGDLLQCRSWLREVPAFAGMTNVEVSLDLPTEGAIRPPGRALPCRCDSRQPFMTLSRLGSVCNGYLSAAAPPTTRLPRRTAAPPR